METTYTVKGMTCQGCVSSLEESLIIHESIDKVIVSLEKAEVKIVNNNSIKLEDVQSLVSEKYTFHEEKVIQGEGKTIKRNKVLELWPLFLAFTYITLGAYFLNYKNPSPNELMSDFMGLFFIVFSFFKFLDIKGFALSFKNYDPIAKKFSFYGFCYPFLELVLGVLFLLRFETLVAAQITIVILSATTIGVIKSLLSKKSIRCACLGSVLNLPMTEATIIENIIMLLMGINFIL